MLQQSTDFSRTGLAWSSYGKAVRENNSKVSYRKQIARRLSCRKHFGQGMSRESWLILYKFFLSSSLIATQTLVVVSHSVQEVTNIFRDAWVPPLEMGRGRPLETRPPHVLPYQIWYVLPYQIWPIGQTVWADLRRSAGKMGSSLSAF